MVEYETLSDITEESSALAAMLTQPLRIFKQLNINFKITGVAHQLLICQHNFLSNVKLNLFFELIIFI